MNANRWFWMRVEYLKCIVCKMRTIMWWIRFWTKSYSLAYISYIINACRIINIFWENVSFGSLYSYVVFLYNGYFITGFIIFCCLWNKNPNEWQEYRFEKSIMINRIRIYCNMQIDLYCFMEVKNKYILFIFYIFAHRTHTHTHHTVLFV